MSSLYAALIGASMVLTQAAAAESNHQGLREFGEAFAGDWIATWEMDFDVPGVVKKGDKVTSRTSTKWTLEKAALEISWKADVNGKPAASGKALIGWDPSSKEVVTFGVGSLPGFDRSTYRKVGDRWIEAIEGVGFDGQKYAGQNITTFSDGGDKMVTVLTGRVSPGGEVLPNLTITATRVKAKE